MPKKRIFTKEDFFKQLQSQFTPTKPSLGNRLREAILRRKK